ncbi:MAG: aldehyde dehydrogenase family protein [Planctomycetota bacterium]|jgi:succinate-semialdehyde dehydrogenase/glutarate-semialdehyde dehydrogenase
MSQTRETVSTSPATGEILGRVPLDTVEQLEGAVEAARAAQPAWANAPIRQRARAMRRVRDHVVRHADELATTVSRETGKTRLDALATEVLPAALGIRYYARRAKRFLKARRLSPASLFLANKRSRLLRVPWGVVGIISPWNYPFGIPMPEVVTALLAGNAVVLKVATQTQLVGRALAQCIEAAELPEGVFSLVNLPGRVAGEALLESGIDKLFFTGSVAVGKTLWAKAADTLTPVCLELGGNDAMLVCPDANLKRAAAGAAWAGLQNCGQSCGGVERVYVQTDVYEPFLELLAEKVRALRVGVDEDHCVDLGAMTTQRQMETVRRHVDDALERGATVYAESPCREGPGYFLPATVLTDVDHSMLVMREETFGPVLGVMPVADMDRAIELANDSHLGLTASVWSRRRRAARRIAARLQAGVVTINDHLMSHGLPETPWGGFKQSGLGRTHGEVGFAEMTQPQCVVDDVMPFVNKDLWWYPHGPGVYRGIRGALDFLCAKGPRRRLVGMWRLLKTFPRVFRS